MNETILRLLSPTCRLPAGVFVLLGLLAAAPPPARAAAPGAEGESLAVEARHLQWLEEVTYILTDQERDAFLALTESKARDQFVEIFWKARDPTPGSQANEYRDEHYRRLEHANRVLGRETPRPGWKTDRGRIYILLGKPRSVSRFPSAISSYEAELWSYAGLDHPGVPPFLNLLFFREGGTGEFKLYVPGVDSPTELLAGNAQMNTPQGALEVLRQVDPELAFAALSVRPGEAGSVDPGRSSFDSIVIHRIADIPRRTVDTSYVQRIAAGSAAIEVEYSFRFLPMSSVARAYYHPGAGLTVDYALEILPQHLTLMQYEDRVYTALDLVGTVQDREERQITAIDEALEIQLKPEELERIRHRPVNLHGRAVAVAGALDFSLLLRSPTTKHYARAEAKLEADDPATAAVWMSEPLPCYRVEPQASTLPGEQERAFQFGSFRVYPRVTSSFEARETAVVYLQLYSGKLSRADLLAHTLRLELLGAQGQSQRSVEASLREAAVEASGRLHLAVELPLADLTPGSYELRSVLRQPGGRERLRRSTPLAILAGLAPAQPWLLSRPLPAPASSGMAVSRAQSSLALERPAEAIAVLESVPIEANPLAADLLLRAYRAAGKPEKVVETFAPVVAPVLYSQARLSFQKAMWCEALIDAHLALGQWGQALLYLERLTQEQPHRPDLLLKLSACHARLGHAPQAEQALRRACALEPSAAECQASKKPS